MKEQEESDKIMRNVDIERSGAKIIVPEKLSLDHAVKALLLKMEQEESEISPSYSFSCNVAEGMVAFSRVLEREMGFVSSLRTPGFFGSHPPRYQSVEVAPGKTETIIFGRVTFPGLEEGYLETAFDFSTKHGLTFSVRGNFKGKYRRMVDSLMEKVRAECRNNSIYKGQAINADFLEPEDLQSIADSFPEFSKLSTVLPEALVFERSVEDQIVVSLFTPIANTARCREHDIPLKRGVLLEGPYGVGKTLTAAATATLCKKHGWTFIYLKNVSQLSIAYTFAEQYQPAVIFAEDIDQVIMQDRDQDVNDVLNALDGIDSKGIEVITVLTTNHVEKITRAMLRPGRLDTVVSVRTPDAEAAARLVRLYAGDRMAPDENLDEVGRVLNGKIPAMIREVVERSKLAAIRRDNGSGNLKLLADDVLVTARAMQNHMELLKPAEKDTDTSAVKAAKITAQATIEAAKIRQGNTHSEGNGVSKKPVGEGSVAKSVV